MNLTCRHAIPFATLLCGLVLNACRHAPEPGPLPAAMTASTAASLPPSRNIVRVGDVLDIVVMEDHALSGQFSVLESGNILVPGIGRIYLLGSTLEAAQNIVRRHIESDQVKKATVIVERLRTSQQAAVAEMPRMAIFVSGAVTKPGQHRVPVQAEGGLTVFEALMIAGGTTRFADLSRSYILRKAPGGDRSRLLVNLQAISRGEARDVQLQEGDIIMVPQRRFGI